MKLSIKLSLCMLWTISLVASSGDPILIEDAGEQAAEQFLVPALSNEAIELAKNKFTIDERKQSRIRALALGGLGLGAGYAFLSWFAPHKPTVAVQASLDAHTVQLAVLREDGNALNRRMVQLEAPQVIPPESWGNFFSRQATWAKDKVVKGTPWFIKSAVSWYVLKEATSLGYGTLTGAGTTHSRNFVRYVSETRSIHWCLTRGTNFYNVIIMFMNWAKTVSVQPNFANCLEDLSVDGMLLKCETEKVLGYMASLTEQLIKSGSDKVVVENSPERRRADVCMRVIREETDRLLVQINSLFTAVDDVRVRKIRLIVAMRTSFFHILNQIENFTVVTQALGLDSEKSQDLCSGLKAYVMPDLVSDKPKVVEEDEDEDLKQIIAQVVRGATQ